MGKMVMPKGTNVFDKLIFAGRSGNPAVRNYQETPEGTKKINEQFKKRGISPPSFGGGSAPTPQRKSLGRTILGGGGATILGRSNA